MSGNVPLPVVLLGFVQFYRDGLEQQKKVLLSKDCKDNLCWLGRYWLNIGLKTPDLSSIACRIWNISLKRKLKHPSLISTQAYIIKTMSAMCLLFYFPVSCWSDIKTLPLRALEMAFVINPNLNTVANGAFLE